MLGSGFKVSMSGGDDTLPLVGATVVDVRSVEIGAVEATAIDPRQGTVDWLVVAVADGRLTALPAFVASVRADGRVAVPFSREAVLDAPALVSRLMTRELAEQLYTYYQLSDQLASP